MSDPTCPASKPVVTTNAKVGGRDRPTMVLPDDGTAEFPPLTTRPNPLSSEEMAERPQEKRKEFVEHFPMSVLDREPNITISRDELIRLLKYENTLRLSQEYQDRYTNMNFNWHVQGEEYDAFAIDREIQIRTLRDNGYHPLETGDESLEAYQVACGHHILDPEVRDCVVWMRYDKMRRGTLAKGMAYRNCDLVDLATGEARTLEQYLPKQADRPLIILGGSYT